MAKTRQVLSFCDNGQEYKVIKVYGATNPYRIYHIYIGSNKYGYPSEHKRLMVSYASLESCFYWFIQNGIGRE